MDTNIKPPESLAEGSDLFIPFQRMDSCLCKIYQARYLASVIVTWIFLLFTWMCLMETSDVRNQLVYSREG